jgi:hypothetical protein
MKFALDLLLMLIGFVLFVATLISLFAVIGYFQGAETGETYEVLRITVPIMIGTLLIAWWKREVLWSFISWAFPTF